MVRSMGEGQHYMVAHLHLTSCNTLHDGKVTMRSKNKIKKAITQHKKHKINKRKSKQNKRHKKPRVYEFF